MKWGDVNLIQGLWSKPKTKTGTPHQVPIPPALVAMLCTFPQTHEWVFPSPQEGGGPLKKTTCFARWVRIRRRAGLEDVTVHDLRRTCASFLAISGENIAVISKVLNHTTLANTTIYARLNQAPVRAALGKHANRLLGMGSVPVTEPAPAVLPLMPCAPTAPPPPQTPAWPPSRVEERDEWPG